MSTILRLLVVIGFLPPLDVPVEPEVRCAAASLCVAARLCGVDVTPDQLQAVLGDRAGADDVSMAEIKAAAEKLGLSCRPASFSSLDQVDLEVPLIVPIRQPPPATSEHFVVLYGGAKSYVQVLDYPWRPRAVRPEEFESRWNGKGLYISSSPAGSPRSLGARKFARQGIVLDLQR